MLAAGSEGEVHLAEVGVAGGVKQVGLKIPHIDGMEALIQVLDVCLPLARVGLILLGRRLLFGSCFKREQILGTLG